MREWADRLPEEIPDGAKLLNDVHAFLGRFVAYPSEHAHLAHTLWIAHTHLMDVWDSTPRIAFLSPEPGSGKTRALEVSELLVPNPVAAVNVSPAYIFHKVADENGAPTLLFDEIDTVWASRRGSMCCARQRDLYRRTSSLLRGRYGGAWLSAGYHPHTVCGRQHARRAPNETIEPYRRRLEVEKGDHLRNRLAVWASNATDQVRDAWPDMPEGIADRNADVWEALFSVAVPLAESGPIGACSGCSTCSTHPEG
jgi:hypothetical protein